MKKNIFLLVIILIIGLTAFYFGSGIDSTIKRIPESAVLL